MPRFSGTAMAAGALGSAVSDLFKGLIGGEEARANIEQRAAEQAARDWTMGKEQAFLPFEARSRSLALVGQEQGLEKGEEELAGLRFEREQRPVRAGREAIRFGREAEEEKRRAAAEGRAVTADERA